MRSIKQASCVCCGARAENNHHPDPKGMGGDPAGLNTITISVCGQGNMTGCHEMFHQNEIVPKWDDKFESWRFVVSSSVNKKRLAALNRRRKNRNLGGVKDGFWFEPYMDTEFDDGPHIDEASEDLGDAIDIIRTKWDELAKEEAVCAWGRANLTQMLLTAFAMEYGPRRGRTMLTEFCFENFTLSRSSLSRLLHWASLGEDAADMGEVKGDLCWRLINKLEWESDKALDFCSSNSVSSIRDEIGVAEQGEVCYCPTCGKSGYVEKA